MYVQHSPGQIKLFPGTVGHSTLGRTEQIRCSPARYCSSEGRLGLPMMVMSQFTLMVAAWAMLMAQPMMTAHTHTLIRDTVISFPPDACTCAAELRALWHVLMHS